MPARARTPRDLEHLLLARRAAADGTAQRLRIANEVTQEEVGSVVGRSPAAVSLWESGRRRPSGPAALRYGRLIASWLNDASEVQ